jgi:hypothetical protein
MKTFFSKIAGWLKRAFTHLPAWETAAQSTLLYAAPLLETVIALVDPTVAPAVNAILDKLKVGFAALSVTIADAGPVVSLESIFASINGNLAELEAAAQIKDPATAQKLTAIVTTIIGEIEAIATAAGIKPAQAGIATA